MNNVRELLLLIFNVWCFGINFTVESVPQRAIEIQWNFKDGLQGWGKSTFEEMQSEIQVSGDNGELRGKITGNQPHIDSPSLLIRAYYRHYIVIRMMYSGDNCDRGAFGIQIGPEVPETFAKFQNNGDNNIRLNFDMIADGAYHIYYIPVWKKVQGTITQIRFFPVVFSDDMKRFPIIGLTFAVDFIMVAKAPTITKVIGCIDQYYNTSNRINPVSNITSTLIKTNGYHSTISTNYFSMSLPFATTFNCLRAGGETVTITGYDFGDLDVIVLINGKLCKHLVSSILEREISCTLPPGEHGKPVTVTLKNAMFHGLLDEGKYLSYADSPHTIDVPTLSNIATHSIDVNWNPPSNFWDAICVTGYIISWKKKSEPEYKNKQIVGNVTSTTVIGLTPRTTYVFVVKAMNEDQVSSMGWKDVDLYGRRSMIENAVLGEFSRSSLPATTLTDDIRFHQFDANSTLDHGAIDSRSSRGPSGEYMGQGHYGLYVVGDANIENCNASSVCCDGLDTECKLTCTAIGASNAQHINAKSNRKVRSNAPGVERFYEVVVKNSSEVIHRPTYACGPSLRLTGSHSFLYGSSWYPRQMNVREGFETEFKFRISNPSTHCKSMDDVYTHCRSRGGDGFAFVIQNHDKTAIGDNGKELGYGGIPNSIAIEFDTWFNYDNFDAYENHISVHTRGWRDKNSANHSFSLGSTVRVPDITDGIHVVKIHYTPVFDHDWLFLDSFTASGHVTNFLTNGDWSQGMGMLSVFVDDMNLAPALLVPLNLAQTLHLNHGRAWVGFTAATGGTSWQVHDILNWKFSSLRIEPPLDKSSHIAENQHAKCDSKNYECSPSKSVLSL